MIINYSSFVRFLSWLRPVILTAMAVIFSGTAVYLNGYGYRGVGRLLRVSLGSEMDSAHDISPSKCGGLFEGEWEYEKVDRDALLQGLREEKRGGGANDDHAAQIDDDGKMKNALKEKKIVVRRKSFDSESRRWRAVLDSKRREMIGLDAGGNLILYETIDESHDARVSYDPPLVLLYADQEAGKVYKQEMKATVWSVKHPERKVDHGSVDRRVVYEGDEQVHTPATGAGMVTAHRVRVTQRMDFERADVDIESTNWYVDGFGRVAIIDLEKVRVLGFIGWDTFTGLLLVRMRREKLQQ